MTYKTVLAVLLSLLILISSWTICGAEELTSGVFPPIEEERISVEIDLQGLQSFDQCLQKQPIMEDLIKKQLETIEKLQSVLSDTKQELELEKRENELNQRMLDLKDKEIEGLNKNFEQMKEVADRAIKLAETSKPKTNWGILGTIILTVFTLGLVVGM